MTVDYTDFAFPKQGKKPRKPKIKKLSPLREFAKGQECTLRIPAICNGNPDTVVLCHVKPKGHGVMGGKPDDWQAVHGCSECHAAIDGQRNWTGNLAEAILPALIETQQRCVDARLMNWRLK